MRKTPRVEHDREANALYIHLSERPDAYGEDLDLERRIDYAEDGTPIGVEFTCVDAGVDLNDVPFAAGIADALKKYGVHVSDRRVVP